MIGASPTSFSRAGRNLTQNAVQMEQKSPGPSDYHTDRSMQFLRKHSPGANFGKT